MNGIATFGNMRCKRIGFSWFVSLTFIDVAGLSEKLGNSETGQSCCHHEAVTLLSTTALVCTLELMVRTEWLLPQHESAKHQNDK
jgi:hypothetical protein